MRVLGELWRDVVDTLRRHPVLWLPALLADLIAYLLNLGINALLHAIVAHQVAQHSVLGGSAVNAPLSASAMQHTAILALLFSWSGNFLRMFLYTGALVLTATLVWSYLERKRSSGAALLHSLHRHLGGMLELALRGIAVYAVAAFLFSWGSAALARGGHAALLRNAVFGYAVSLLVLFLLSMLLPPVAIRILSGQTPTPPITQRARVFAFTLVFVASVLAAFVTGNTRELAQVSPAVRYPLEIVASLMVALPYVLIFTGLALLSRRNADTPHPTEA